MFDFDQVKNLLYFVTEVLLLRLSSYGFRFRLETLARPLPRLPEMTSVFWSFCALASS